MCRAAVQGRSGLPLAEIPEEKIAEIRDRLDIVAVIGRSVSLKKAGRSWRGLCPFHQEKTPSFHVDSERKLYHCFGCKAGGDVFRFVMEYEGRTFPETLQSLAAEVGVKLPDSFGQRDSAADATRRRRDVLREANQRAGALFGRWLHEDSRGEAGRRHLQQRGIEGPVAKRFGLGFAPLRNDLRAQLVRAGMSESLLEEAGLLARGDRGTYERFRGRLMVPIRDIEGRAIAFGARLVEGDHPAKYLNSPETAVYRKSETLFGLHEARPHIRREGKAIVVEGYFDVLALAQAGVENVVATCGTALTKEHCRLLSRHSREILLVFDGDAAGFEAQRRVFDVAANAPGMILRVVNLPQGDDPDSFVRREGAEAFKALCLASVPLAEVLIERALEGVGRAVEDRVRALERVKPYIERVKDPLVRRLYVQRVAERLGMEERALLHRFGTGASFPREKPCEQPEKAPDQPVSHLSADEEALCLLLLEQPYLLENSAVEACLVDLMDDHSRALVASLLEEWQDRHQVDVGARLEGISDASIRRRWRDHIARMANMDASGASPAHEDQGEATRKLELILERIARHAKRRRQEVLARETSRITDPVERARRIQATKSLGRTGSMKVRA